MCDFSVTISYFCTKLFNLTECPEEATYWANFTSLFHNLGDFGPKKSVHIVDKVTGRAKINIDKNWFYSSGKKSGRPAHNGL